MTIDNEAKTNKLSIYLIKQEFNDNTDIIKCKNTPIEIEGVGDFMFDDSYQKRPSWIENFFGSVLDDQKIFSSSAKGITLIPVDTPDGKRIFAVSFGSGRYLLKEGVIEERFGLKIVLNSVNIDSFRSIDKTTLGSIPKHSREQMSRDVTPAEFGIDVEQDLISSVTGKSRDENFGKTVSGRDALSVSVKKDIHNIVEFLEHCYTRYKSNDYKRDFDWIDQIAEVKNKLIIEELDQEIVTKINNNDIEKIWMAVPEVVDWSDIQGFRYKRGVQGKIYDDLDLLDFLSELNRSPEIHEFKYSSIFAISASTDYFLYKWSAYQCIYAECKLNGKLFILNNSKWYEIAESFSQEVEMDFGNTSQSTLIFPDCGENIHEDVYNNYAVKTIPEACCMDKQLVMHGGGHNKIEFCDIYTKTGKIIHVKQYGNSSVLSHLFNQGVVSGELFIADSNFRVKLNEKLPTDYKIADTQSRPVAPEYEIVYAIISNSESELDLPFFSKVSLRNAKRRLRGYGYNVTIKKIQKDKSVPS